MGVMLKKKNYYQKTLLFNSLLQAGFCFGDFSKKWSFSTGGFLLGIRFKFLTFDLDSSIFFLRRFYFFVKRCSSFNSKFSIIFQDHFIFSSTFKTLSLGLEKLSITFIPATQSFSNSLQSSVPDIVLFLADRSALVKEIKNLGFPIIGFLKELLSNPFFLYPILGNGGFAFILFLWGFFLKSFRAGRFSLFRFMQYKRKSALKFKKIGT